MDCQRSNKTMPHHHPCVFITPPPTVSKNTASTYLPLLNLYNPRRVQVASFPSSGTRELSQDSVVTPFLKILKRTFVNLQGISKVNTSRGGSSLQSPHFKQRILPPKSLHQKTNPPSKVTTSKKESSKGFLRRH